MLFWHNQPEHLWPSPGELYPGPPSSLLREALPLPYLKQEELANILRVEQPCPALQYMLCAATSPVVKQQEETLTYLNQDVPLSMGVLEPQVLPSQLNTVEFYWDPTKRTSLFLQVHCISTEFTPRKKGGEKGVPFCLQIDTFKPSDKELPLEHLHSAGCLVKVFKPKGADQKLKTDWEKIEKEPVHERNKYQTACESTVFMEGLNPGASILETQQWLHRHRFSSYCQLLASFTGTDLLKLTRQDLIQICGAADGIRLFNTLKARPIRHRLTLYVAQETSRQDDEAPKNPDSGFYQELSLDELSAVELLGKLAELLALPANQIHRLFHQGPGGILILLSDQVVQNLKDESYFVAVVKKVQNPDGYYLVLT
ncbi:hypothetical protein MJG53_015285 [Ovis ammon polii x Ovis aries]|uniref:Uncharacterized protein n=1 Tax=Ovis ammon polii x Ovis aries TaxID=2918886 RepID=A0ACB9UEZ6_9CETA|nr:hypothetical protein MJG53_015285 [Ovis ammon polii x Ovis aries]